MIHQGALGDWVLLFGLLRALAARGSGVVAVTGWSKANLARAVNIERPEFTALHRRDGGGDVAGGLGGCLEGVVRVIAFVGASEGVWAANLGRALQGVTVATVRTDPSAGWRSHITRWHRWELRRQGMRYRPIQPAPGGDPDGPIVIHPGSGGREKCWPLARYEELVDRVRGSGRVVRVILGEAETDRWAGADLAHWERVHEARVVGSLEGLHRCLAGAAVFIGNDAGPTHLAAQLGVATVGLFGPTRPALWAPIGPLVRVIAPRTPRAMGWLDVSTVFDACGFVGRAWI